MIGTPSIPAFRARPTMSGQALYLGLCLCQICGAKAAWASGPAGIKLDGTLGPSAAALAGPAYSITQNLGRLSGGNLFFSFQYFNVATGETALFTTTSAGINNVISRVTGGYASTIDGTIALQAVSGAPNFFLINPGGVTFTAHAVVDVPAAFYVSTANYLKFGDGIFYVDPSRMSTLSAAAPEAFGFLGTTRAPVILDGANLSAGVNGEGEFQITAGDVTVDGGGALIGIQNKTGGIRVTAVGNASAEVPLSGPFTSTDGTVTISNGGSLLTQGLGSTDGGAIDVDANNLLIDGLGLAINDPNFQQTGITSTTDYAGTGSGVAGSINVHVSNDTHIVNGAAIGSQTVGSGRSGDVYLASKHLTIDGENSAASTGISTFTQASGVGGNILANVVEDVYIKNGGAIKSFSFATGSAGDVRINTGGQLSLLNGGAIGSETDGPGKGGGVWVSASTLTIDSGLHPNHATELSDYTLGTGSAGNIVVNVAGQTSVLNFGEIISNTFADGKAGNITLHTGSLTIDGGPSLFIAGIDAAAETVGPGSGGAIAVTVNGSTLIQNGGELSTSTYGSGNAGNISLSSAALTIKGPTGATNSAEVQETGILSNTYGTGNAGRVSLELGSLEITGGNPKYFVGISSATNAPFGLLGPNPGGTGSAGSVVVDVSLAATLTDGGQVSTSTYGPGAAGNVSVSADRLQIGLGVNASEISSQAYSEATGQVGQIKINAGVLMLEDAGSISVLSQVKSTPYGTLPTGIQINAREIDLRSGAVNAASIGNLAASSIDISYSSEMRMDSGKITTTAVDGNGGPIAISGKGPLFLDHSFIATSVTGSRNGSGGNIGIDAPEIVMNTGAIQANTSAPRASGGTITIHAQALLPSFQSFTLGGKLASLEQLHTGLNVVQAAAPDGVNGTLSVTVPALNLGNALLGLTGRTTAPVALGHDLCRSTRGSSLAFAGRGGIAPTAYDPLWISPEMAWRQASISSTYPVAAATDARDIDPEWPLGCR